MKTKFTIANVTVEDTSTKTSVDNIEVAVEYSAQELMDTLKNNKDVVAMLLPFLKDVMTEVREENITQHQRSMERDAQRHKHDMEKRTADKAA